MGYTEMTIEGRNAVMEAFRSGKTIDKLYVLDGCQDGPVLSIKREAKKQDCLIKYVKKERLDQMSETGRHQGVIAHASAYHYAEVQEILDNAKEKGEEPFLFLLDNIEDPHNLGAIIRTASTPAATEAFKESIFPFMGMDAAISQFSFISLPTPSPSLPIIRPIGPFKFKSYITVPPISAQTNHIPSFFNSSIV